MRVVISSNQKEEESKIKQTDSKAEFYLVFDAAKLVKTIKNIFGNKNKDLSVKVLKVLNDSEAKLVLGTAFGKHGAVSVTKKGINFKDISENITVKDALKLLEK